MKITLNGEPKEVQEGITLQGILDTQGIPPERVACEVNVRIVKRGHYSTTVLKEGDEVEIVQMVGGG